jgi:hypothetical protein
LAILDAKITVAKIESQKGDPPDPACENECLKPQLPRIALSHDTALESRNAFLNERARAGAVLEQADTQAP